MVYTNVSVGVSLSMKKDKTKQTITLTLFSVDDDYSCNDSELKIEGSLYNDKHISESVTGMGAECLFSLVKDFMNQVIKEEKEKKDGQTTN